MEMARLNIGCGYHKKEGWINLDINPRAKPDILRDIRNGLPFSNCVIDEVLCEHILEHLDGEELIEVMNEIHRVLKPWGKLEIAVPIGKNSYVDPRHKQHFIPESFDFFYLPDANSVEAGIKGWFMPKKFIMKDMEFRWLFEKIPAEELKEHLEKYIVDKETWTFDFKYLKEDQREQK